MTEPLRFASEPLVNAKTAADYLGMHPRQVTRMASLGRIPYVGFPMGRSGRILYRFRMSELQAYTESLYRKAVVMANHEENLALKAS